MEQISRKQRINSWYEEYSNDVYNYAFFMLGDREQAMDIVQDTFIRAYNKLESFQGGREKSWLFRIARNLTIDYMRKKRTLANYLSFLPFGMNTEKSAEDIAIFNESENSYIWH